MEPARLRSPGSLPQRVQDVAERLSTHAKAELYEVLEGIAPSGELSALLRLEPLVNDIVAQLSDSFKQAVTKRLLPEACKLLGARASSLGSAPPWPSGQPSPGPAASSLLGGPGGQYALQSHSLSQSYPVHFDNDITAFSLAPGSGQPLRSDQGPPQRVASAAASSLLTGAPNASAAAPLSPPLSTAAGGGSISHPPESRFAFANPSGGGAEERHSGSLHRNSLTGGGGGTDAAMTSESLRFLSLAGDGVVGSAAALGLSLGLGLGDTGAASANGGAAATPSEALLSYISNGSSPAVISTSTGFDGGSGLATPALSRGLAALSLGNAGSDASGGAHRGPGGTPPSVSSSPSPHPPAAVSPYSSLPLPLSIRPGSSLDPGLATPPVSLAGTEPLRSAAAAAAHTHAPSQAGGAQSGRHGGGAELEAPVPAPLFGGAPGPSPGGSHHHYQLQQHQQQQQQQLAQRQAQWQGGDVGHAAAVANGNGSNGYLSPQHNQTQYQQQQQQQQYPHPSAFSTYALEQQQQQQQQQQSPLGQGQGQGAYAGAGSAAVQAQLQQQLQQAAGFGGGGGAQGLSGRSPHVAAPEGPRASLDGRSLMPGGFGLGGQGGMQQQGFGAAAGQISGLQYDGTSLLEQAPQLGLGMASERYSAVGRGLESPEYGLYSAVAQVSGGGMSGQQRGEGLLLGPGMGPGLVSPPSYGIAGGGGGNGGGRGGGSPAMMTALMLPPGGGAHSPGPGVGMGLGAQPERVSRSGAASAASAAESRSSSFSGAVAGAHRGSGSGGAATPPLATVQHSPPASDASGPSSCASAVLGSAGRGGLAPGSPAPPGMSMAAKLQQVATKPVPPHGPTPGTPGTPGRSKAAPAQQTSPGGAATSAHHLPPGGGGSGSGGKAPPDMPGRFRCLPAAVQARIATLTRDNHVVLLKDFDEKVLSKMTLLVDKFGSAECLAMLDRIEEVLKGKAGRLANGPGYLDVSVSTRLDELKQRASGQVTAPEDYARSTLHSRIYAELRDLIARHGFLQWHHFDQGIINMLKKMPNATALERLNELAYHSFKNVDNPKSCIVSIFTTKPKYVNA